MKLLFNKDTYDLTIMDGKNFYYFDIDDYETLTYYKNNTAVVWIIYNGEMTTIQDRHIHVLEVLFNIRYELYNWVFINNNKYDMHRKNIYYTQKYNTLLLSPEIKIIKTFNGKLIKHFDNYSIKNIYWLVELNGFKYYMMTCDDKTIKISITSIELVLNYYKYHYWKCYDSDNISNNTYVHSVILINENNKLVYKKIYLHKLIFENNIQKNYDENGSNILHINGDIYDNREENLKIEYKKTRKINAKEVPSIILNNLNVKLPKYVVYYKEKYGESEEEKKLKTLELKKNFKNDRKIKLINKELFEDTRKIREFFKIENHPQSIKPWYSCKSITKTIEKKYLETLIQLKIFNNIL
jgi:hypothetical protein